MTILWIIKFSVVVHLCVEISFCWWNWLCLFFNLKHQINWYLTETKYFSATDLNSASPLNTFKFLSVINIQWIVFPIHSSQRSSDTEVCYSSSYALCWPILWYYNFEMYVSICKEDTQKNIKKYIPVKKLFYTVTAITRFAWKRIFWTITLYEKLFFVRLLSNYLLWWQFCE